MNKNYEPLTIKYRIASPIGIYDRNRSETE